MELISRPLEKTDYPALKTWWTLHSWPAVPQEALPKNGLIIEHLGQRICAGFIYSTDSSIAWLEYIISNPLCDKLIRDKALDLLISGLIELAKSLGKTVVFTSVKHPSLIKRYAAHGAIETENNMTNMVWRI
jgi:hypothetical protein